MKILIYSTEESVRDTIKGVLGDHHEMILVDSIEQGQECIKNAEIGTLIYDVDKQDESLENIEKFHSEYPDLNILVIVGYKAVEWAAKVVSLGASGYIVKPIKADELLSACK